MGRQKDFDEIARERAELEALDATFAKVGANGMSKTACNRRKNLQAQERRSKLSPDALEAKRSLERVRSARHRKKYKAAVDEKVQKAAAGAEMTPDMTALVERLREQYYGNARTIEEYKKLIEDNPAPVVYRRLEQRLEEVLRQEDEFKSAESADVAGNSTAVSVQTHCDEEAHVEGNHDANDFWRIVDEGGEDEPEDEECSVEGGMHMGIDKNVHEGYSMKVFNGYLSPEVGAFVEDYDQTAKQFFGLPEDATSSALGWTISAWLLTCSASRLIIQPRILEVFLGLSSCSLRACSDNCRAALQAFRDWRAGQIDYQKIRVGCPAGHRAKGNSLCAGATKKWKQAMKDNLLVKLAKTRNSLNHWMEIVGRALPSYQAAAA